MNNPERARNPQPPKMSDEDFERFYRDIYAEFGPVEDVNEDLTKDIPRRHSQSVKAPSTAPRPAAKVSQTTYADTRRAAPPVRKDNSIKALTIAVCLECLGIVGVVLWWVLRIL